MTILETVIAATLISVAVIASLRLSTNTQKEATYARDLSLATKYNSQAIDWLKSVKNSLGWTDLSGRVASSGGSVLYCLSTLANDPNSYLTLSNTTKTACSANKIPGTTQFYRLVEINLDGGGESMTILVKTYWQGKAEYNVTSETYLTNY